MILTHNALIIPQTALAFNALLWYRGQVHIRDNYRKGDAVGSPWYSIEGHPAPFEENFKREKRVIVQLRLRNATFGHLEQAAGRISSIRIEVGKVNTPKGVVAGLAVTEPGMTMEEIDEVIKELKVHLGSIINSRDTVSEIISRRRYVSQRLAASKESGHYFNRPPYR